jgi:hypothetical protein
MIPGEMSGLLPPEPACAVKGTFIGARFKMMPVLQAPVFVLIPRALKYQEHDLVKKKRTSLSFFNVASLLGIEEETRSSLYTTIEITTVLCQS